MNVFSLFRRPFTHGILALLLLLSLSPARAQDVTLSAGTPEEVGMSPGILQGGVELRRESMAAGDLVGAVVLVAKDGKVAFMDPNQNLTVLLFTQSPTSRLPRRKFYEVVRSAILR